MAQPRPQTVVGWLIFAVNVCPPVTAVGVSLIWTGIDPARAYFAGTPGQVTAWTPGATLLGQIIAGLFLAAIAPAFGLYYWRRDRRARAAEQALNRAEREKMSQEIADLRKELRDIETDLKSE